MIYKIPQRSVAALGHEIEYNFIMTNNKIQACHNIPIYKFVLSNVFKHSSKFHKKAQTRITRPIQYV